jgi:hypothetical protein
MTTLADSSLLQSLKEEGSSLSLEKLLAPALHQTSWEPSFVLRALTFLNECTASPSFIQRKFPKEFAKYGFPSLVLPPFEKLVAMARVLDYLRFPVSALKPLVREVTDCVEFPSSGLRESPLFYLKEIDSRYRAFLPFLASNGLLLLLQRVYSEEKTQLDVLRWRVRPQNLPCPWDGWTCAHAAQNGHLDVLRWIRSQVSPCPWDEWICDCAAENGYLDVLQWLRAQDPPCPWSEWTCLYAAQNGHLAVLKWLRSQYPPCPWNEWACVRAAEHGHLDVLKWLRAQNPPCPWNEDACISASLSGHLGVLQWVRAQDPPCPWNKEECLQKSRDEHVRQWIEAQPS